MFEMSIKPSRTKIKEPQPKYPFSRYRTSVLLAWLEDYTILWCEARDAYRESRGLDITVNYNTMTHLAAYISRVREILRCRGRGDAARAAVYHATEDYQS